MKITRTRFVAILLFIVSFIVLWIYRSQQQFADGLSYALLAKAGHDMFNPHDMILPFVIHLLYKVALLFSPHADVLTIAQLHNTFMGAITIVCAFLIAYKIIHWFLSAFSVAFALAISGGFWLFIAVVEVYVPAQAWLAIAATILIYRSKAVYTGTTWIWVSLCIVCSTLYHQTGVLFIIPLLVYTASMPAEYKNKWKVYAKTVALAAGLLLSAYIVVFIHNTHSFSVVGFYKYCFQYYYTLKQYNTDWGTLNNVSKSGLSKFFKSIIVSIYSVEPGTALQLKWIVGTCWLVLIAGMMIYAMIPGSRNKATILFFSTWLLAYGIFLLWWTPGFEFFSLLLFPLWLLVFLALYRVILLTSNWLVTSPTVATCMFVISLFLLIHNMPVFIAYHTEDNIGMREAKRFHTLLDDSGMAICNYNTQTHIRYYFPGEKNIENIKYLGMFYTHHPLPTEDIPVATDKIAIPLWQFTPWYDWNGINGWSKPNEWEAFSQSILHITKQSDSLYTAHAFRIVNGNKPDEDAFLYVDKRIRTYPSVQAVFMQLDSAIKASGDTKNIVFVDWYKKNALLLP